MAVYSQQSDDGVTQQPLQIVNDDDLSDADLLARKAASHEARGWTVTTTGPTTFTAEKVRWESVQCVREFWIEA